MNIIAEKAGVPGGFVIGAGAGSPTYVGVNSEVRFTHFSHTKTV
jgi:hypothetical protein